MINPSDTIGNRTRDLPACNAAPRPTALPLPYLQFLSQSPAQGHSPCDYTTHRDIDPPDPISLLSTSLREPQMNWAASDRPATKTAAPTPSYLCNDCVSHTVTKLWKKLKVKNRKIVPAYATKAYRGRRRKAPLILSLGTSRRWAVGFKTRHFTPRKDKGTNLTESWVRPRVIFGDSDLTDNTCPR